MIALQNIDKSFNGEHILQNVSLEIPDNQICGVFGKSGIGKSTLAKYSAASARRMQAGFCWTTAALFPTIVPMTDGWAFPSKWFTSSLMQR